MTASTHVQKFIGLVSDIAPKYYNGVEAYRPVEYIPGVSIAKKWGKVSDKTAILNDLIKTLEGTVKPNAAPNAADHKSLDAAPAGEAPVIKADSDTSNKKLRAVALAFVKFAAKKAADIESETGQCKQIFAKLEECAETILETREPKPAASVAPTAVVTVDAAQETNPPKPATTTPGADAKHTTPQKPLTYEDQFKLWAAEVDALSRSIEAEYKAINEKHITDAREHARLAQAILDKEAQHASQQAEAVRLAKEELRLQLEGAAKEERARLQSEAKASEARLQTQLTEDAKKAEEALRNKLKIDLLQQETALKEAQRQSEAKLETAHKEKLATALKAKAAELEANHQKDKIAAITAEKEAQKQAERRLEASLQEKLSAALKAKATEHERDKTAAVNAEKAKYEALDRSFKQLTLTNSKLQADLKKASDELKLLKETRTQITEKMIGQINSLTSQLSEMKAKFERSTKNYDQLVTEHNDLVKKHSELIAEAQRNLDQNTRDAIRSRDRNATLLADNTRLISDKDKLTEQNAELKRINLALEKQLTALQGRIALLETEIKRLNTERELIAANHRTLQETLKSAQSELANQIRDNQALKDARHSATKPAVTAASKKSATAGFGAFDHPHVAIPIDSAAGPGPTGGNVVHPTRRYPH